MVAGSKISILGILNYENNNALKHHVTPVLQGHVDIKNSNCEILQ